MESIIVINICTIQLLQLPQQQWPLRQPLRVQHRLRWPRALMMVKKLLKHQLSVRWRSARVFALLRASPTIAKPSSMSTVFVKRPWSVALRNLSSETRILHQNWYVFLKYSLQILPKIQIRFRSFWTKAAQRFFPLCLRRPLRPNQPQ